MVSACAWPAAAAAAAMVSRNALAAPAIGLTMSAPQAVSQPSVTLFDAQRALELFRIRRGVDRGLDADQAGVDQVEQVLIEQLHAVEVAALADLVRDVLQ